MTDPRVEKGLRGEREAHQILKEWWGGSPWRVVGRYLHGPDLVTPETFPFDVEVKHHRRARVRWIVSSPFLLLDWWSRAKAISRKPPLLLVKAEGIWLALVRRRDLGTVRLPETFFSMKSLKGDRLVGCRLRDLVTTNPRSAGAPRAPKRVRLPRRLTKFRVMVG